MSEGATIHASAVLVGAQALLIQGPSGSGKSRLVLALLQAAEIGLLPFARLVADDRALIEVQHGRVLIRPAPMLAGLVEVRGLGIRRLPYEPVAVVGAVADLAVGEAARMPEPKSRVTELAGVRLPRLAVAAGVDPLSPVLAFFRTPEATS